MAMSKRLLDDHNAWLAEQVAAARRRDAERAALPPPPDLSAPADLRPVVRDLSAVGVAGRLLRKPTAKITVYPKGMASIRVDDDADDAFWLTIELTRQQVTWILAEMDRMGAR